LVEMILALVVLVKNTKIVMENISRPDILI